MICPNTNGIIISDNATSLSYRANGEKGKAMIEFTEEMLTALKAANDPLKGTPEYYTYHMITECKDRKGKWVFIDHYIPFTTGFIKEYRGKMYIITKDDRRYHVTDPVKQLLGICSYAKIISTGKTVQIYFRHKDGIGYVTPRGIVLAYHGEYEEISGEERMV